MDETITCGHCGKTLLRDPVLHTVKKHAEGCGLPEDHLAAMETLLQQSNPFVAGVSIKRADLFALVAEIKTLRALLGKESYASEKRKI